MNIKLEIGGTYLRDGWRNLDYNGLDGELCFNIRTNPIIPLPDNSIIKVFSSHTIEHAQNHSIQHLFKELHRMCRDGAVLRFACPDADYFYEQYKLGQLTKLTRKTEQTQEEILANWFTSYRARTGVKNIDSEKIKELDKTLTKEELFDYIISCVDFTQPYIAHCNWFNFDKLKNMLEEAGFKNIVKSEYKMSHDDELRNGDFDLHESISLYVECEK